MTIQDAIPEQLISDLARRVTSRTTFVRLSCAIARAALRFVPDNDDRPRRTIDAVERWLAGDGIDHVDAVHHAKTESWPPYEPNPVIAHALSTAWHAADAVERADPSQSAIYAAKDYADAAYTAASVDPDPDAYYYDDDYDAAYANARAVARAARQQASADVCAIIRRYL
jgi:hypothetical protein